MEDNALLDRMEALGINPIKSQELLKNKRVRDNFVCIFGISKTNNKLFFSLALTLSSSGNEALPILVKGIEKKQILHEQILKGCINANPKTEEELMEFIESTLLTDAEMEQEISKLKGTKKEIMKAVSRHPKLKYASSKKVNEIVDRIDNIERGTSKKRDWLSEGQLSKIHRPGENPQKTQEIMDAHLERTGGMVITRFPPEPNGFLHIGHAKAMNLSFEFAKKYGGKTYLRFDDTNPKNEKKEYYESIKKDVEWLGFTPCEVRTASGYFEEMIKFAFKLIRKGKAYVCHMQAEEIRKCRKEGNLISPWRDRSAAVNEALFQEMIDGKWNEGEICLRLKMDIESKNPLMYDLIAYRVIKKEHPITGNKYCVYPSYDFTHCINDSLEDITHSFCSREFYVREESYYWLLDELDLYKPVQWEFSRLNISNTVLSKRKLTKLVEAGIVNGWDDPRLYTIGGIRRRGFTPAAVNKFVQSVGITFSESIIDVKLLENYVREDLNMCARRIMCVKNPLKIKILNFDGPSKIEIEDMPGSEIKRWVEVSDILYIEKSDFMENPTDDFQRLTLNQSVGLMKLFPIKVREVTEDGLIVERSNEKPKKFIHWVSEFNTPVELRFYYPLFKSFNPEESKDFMEDINENTLEIFNGLADNRIKDSKVGDKFQFLRMGYFCVDSDTSASKIVLNLTLSLKNIV
ncbi:putative glutamine--tRNA ligase [Astathelohania contejeani]|uniref:glutamine--tRNA ligase n=1 Tax=Astathelohania contejeani TaxID=164912 RepID=A0ABQ7HXM1_9MICR|nr:putative glutamine--tRNA ligase [Thelohania contejeani]